MRQDDELSAWNEKRREARRRDMYFQGDSSLSCRKYPWEYELSEDSNAAKEAARRGCEGCPVLDICLDDALRAEAGLRAADRFGIIAGLDAEERVKEARKRGCPVCGETLPSSGKSLYCKAHATRSGRDQALSHSA